MRAAQIKVGQVYSTGALFKDKVYKVKILAILHDLRGHMMLVIQRIKRNEEISPGVIKYERHYPAKLVTAAYICGHELEEKW